MKLVFITVLCAAVCFRAHLSNADNPEERAVASKITAVKLYQNQAAITRTVSITLVKGMNRIMLGSLPPLLYDWSVQGSLRQGSAGSIVSLQVVKKALVKKKLKALRERDQVFVDELKIILSQEKFLDSVMDFTNQAVSRELMTRIPNTKVWEGTLTYAAGKRKALLAKKRVIQREREEIGRSIQKWEFELSQIAGSSYFNTYRSLNTAILTNRAAMQVQQYADIADRYAERTTILKNPTQNVDIEKRLLVEISAPAAGRADFDFTYVIPHTAWEMTYDVRADSARHMIGLFVYGDIRQTTGENWEDIALSLSTGAPASAISPPEPAPWYIDIAAPYRSEEAEYPEGAARAAKSMNGRPYRKTAQKAPRPEETGITEKGPYFEISFPVRQDIASSVKSQKKFIREFLLEKKSAPRFFYEAVPEEARTGYLKAAVKNTTGLPWLSGEAQIFLDGEFMGKTSMPAMAPGMEEEIVLGVEPRIAVKKELVRKHEDTAGLMGGRRRISYKYKITVENRLARGIEVFVYDSMPLSRNEKIDVKVRNLSHRFVRDENFRKTTRYARGIRKWRLAIGAGAKKEITYDAVISFDKTLDISGMR
jgi:uncharacterized protein (TIGR02231 family)